MNTRPHEHKARVLTEYPRTSIINTERTNREKVATEGFTRFQPTYIFLVVDSPLRIQLALATPKKLATFF
jgi:hypothetical protein